MEIYKGAEAFVDVLNSFGVEYIFFNPGIDTVPLQVTVSRLRNEGKKAPGLVLCLDESVAMAAAYGHYGISGKPQVVLVHRELGTLQVGGQMHNAYFGRVPVMLCAGSLAPTNRVTWTGEPYNPCYMTRNCVKWDYEMSSRDDIAEIAWKALETAYSEPRAPVYLSTSVDAYGGGGSHFSIPLRQAVPQKTPDPEALRKAAEILLAAEKPLILAGNSGRYPETVNALIELAEILGARVINSTVRVSFPTSHPLCAGVDPIGGGTRDTAGYFSAADALLLIEYDLPYAPFPLKPAERAKIVTIDLDLSKKAFPLWGHSAEVFIESESYPAIRGLIKVINQILTEEKRRAIQEQVIQLKSEHQHLKSERIAKAKSRSSQKPISPDWLCHRLGEMIHEDTIIVNQVITQSSSVFEQIARSLPGTWLGCAGGSIGWALGAALGAKLAAPQKNVVSLMGDGAFIWGCPTATLWTAGSYQAPFLSVIFNNQSYGAIKGLVNRAYGEEGLSAKQAFDCGVEIAPPPDYAMIARACGAYGRTVQEPDELIEAFREGFREVEGGRCAVLDIRLV
ncbi:MAG: thiamine pyrophosphate-binding protein [Dehalococcoidales bacterium]|nr:thiamine pyrophosphate-binding protein [Dehalococcoidales bacterium]